MCADAALFVLPGCLCIVNQSINVTSVYWFRRGVALAVQRKSDAPGQRVKLEPGLQPSMTANQQPSTWQLPQQPTEQKVAAAVPVSTLLAGIQLQAVCCVFRIQLRRFGACFATLQK